PRRETGSQMRLTPTTAMTLAAASRRNSRRRRVPSRGPIAWSIGAAELLDDALGPLEERERGLQPDRPRRDEIDRKHKLVRDLDRDLGRRHALEDAVDDPRRLLAHPPVVSAVRDQRAGSDHLVLVRHQRYLVLARAPDEEIDAGAHEARTQAAPREHGRLG